MVDFVDGQRRARRTTLIHSYTGFSRSGMVVTAYLMYKNGWTRDEALEFVRSKRPMVNPNHAFMQLLLEWEISVAAGFLTGSLVRPNVSLDSLETFGRERPAVPPRRICDSRPRNNLDTVTRGQKSGNNHLSRSP